MYIYVCTHICTRICIMVCMYIYMYTCIYYTAHIRWRRKCNTSVQQRGSRWQVIHQSCLCIYESCLGMYQWCLYEHLSGVPLYISHVSRISMNHMWYGQNTCRAAMICNMAVMMYDMVVYDMWYRILYGGDDVCDDICK